ELVFLVLRDEPPDQGAACALVWADEQAEENSGNPEGRFRLSNYGENRRDDEADQRNEDCVASADPVIDETENQRTKPGRNVQRDPEQDDLIEGEVECPDRIDAAEGKDGHQSVVVDQSREEHPEDL